MAHPRYDESAVRVLKGLEPVKERPGMYTRTQDPTHICQEVIDNAADEALAGFAKKIEVTLYQDGSLAVQDDGRGIPVGIHPEEGVPTVEVVFTRLHAGGKFNKKEGGAYAFSGGLHGVGVSVSNALSSRLEVHVQREGFIHQMAFSEGDVIEPLIQKGKCLKKQTGTYVRLWPKVTYFDSPKINLNELERLLRSKAVLLPGVEVSLRIEKAPQEFESVQWKYPNGLVSYLDELLGEEASITPILFQERFIGKGEDTAFTEGEGASWALVWMESSGGAESYVNLIPTPAGGTHEAGLRGGVFEAVKAFIEHHHLLPRGIKLQAEDVCAKMRYVLSARLIDPQFQGQTKEKLSNREAVRLVSTMIKPLLEVWLNEHIEEGKKIAELAIRQAMQRQKSAKKVEKKKGSGVAVLPGKLTDCESQDIRENELFLVEGDSAGGSAKMARDKSYQAILPLRGKVLNSWETPREQLFSNHEIHDISVALGIDPHEAGEAVDLSGLRYGKIAILSDADVDGAHIQVLLLTLFFKHFPALIEAGHVYIARPPLFRIDVPSIGKTRPARTLYALDEIELHQWIERLKKEKIAESRLKIGRFKGLGEMNPDQLRETTLSPDTRRLLPVSLPQEGRHPAENTFHLLMSRGESSARRAWMEREGDNVQIDI